MLCKKNTLWYVQCGGIFRIRHIWAEQNIFELLWLWHHEKALSNYMVYAAIFDAICYGPSATMMQYFLITMTSYERHVVSNHRSPNCLFSRLCGPTSKKQRKSALLALWVVFTGDRWIPRTKGQWRGKSFLLITSSYWYFVISHWRWCNMYYAYEHPSDVTWRHSVSNHHQLDCFPASCLSNDKENTKAPQYGPYVRGIHRWQMDSTKKDR